LKVKDEFTMIIGLYGISIDSTERGGKRRTKSRVTTCVFPPLQILSPDSESTIAAYVM